MKSRVFMVVGLMTSVAIHADDAHQTSVAKTDTKKNLVQVEKKETEKMTGRTVTLSEMMSEGDLKIDATIAFVDSFAIMGECEQGKKARTEIENKRDLATGDLQEEAKKIEKAKNEYVSKSTTMSESAREKEEKQLIKRERDFKNLVAEKEEELKIDMQLATEKLAQDLEEGVRQLAQSENLDIVFDKMTGRALYVSAEYDYTEKAIKQVNNNYEVKLAQNKSAAAPVRVADNKTAKPAKIAA
jgi:outer membrane protein